ncbi:MAG: hypothetical protein ACF8R9_13550 [Phycisphaerales bacterium JB054]
MPRIVNRAFSQEFADRRDALLKVVRERCKKRPATLAKAAARLETEYPDRAVRARIKAQTIERAKRSAQTTPTTTSSRPSLNLLRAERLAWAMQDAVAAVQRQDHENPIGPHLKKSVREANALLYVVLAGLVLDPDAEEWVGDATPSARCPWTAQQGVGRKGKGTKTPHLTGYMTRGDVFLDRGHEALALLSVAADRLGWVAMDRGVLPRSEESHMKLSMPIIAVDAMREDTPSFADQVSAAREAFARFYELLDAVSVPVDGGRRVNGALHAAKLSELTSVLYAELAELQRAIFRSHGELVSGPSAGVSLRVSDSPTGEGTVVALPDVRVHRVSVGGSGVDALLMAALLDATRVTGFSTEQWNSHQADRPGGPHQRWAAGDVIPQADLDVLDSASKQLALCSKWMETSDSSPNDPPLEARSNPESQTTDETLQIPPVPERRVRRVREPTEKQRMPENPTRPISLTEAAPWFGLKDPRTLRKAIERGSVKARQISALKWVFDLTQVQEPVREDARPKQ